MRASLDQRGYSTLSPVNAGMGDPLGILPATQVNSAFRPYVVGKWRDVDGSRRYVRLRWEAWSFQGLKCNVI